MNARTVEELTEFFVREIDAASKGPRSAPGRKVANGGTIDAFGEKLLRPRQGPARRRCADYDSLSGAMCRRQAGRYLRKRGARPVKGTHRPHRQQPPTIRWDSRTAGITWAWISCRAAAPRAWNAAAATRGPSPGTNVHAQIKNLVDAGLADRIMLETTTLIAMSLQPTSADRHGLRRTRMEFSL